MKKCMGNPGTGISNDTLNVRSIRKSKKQRKNPGENNTMKGLCSEMVIPAGGLNLRDKYRDREQSDDEFSLVDIEDAI